MKQSKTKNFQVFRFIFIHQNIVLQNNYSSCTPVWYQQYLLKEKAAPVKFSSSVLSSLRKKEKKSKVKNISCHCTAR